MSVAKQMLKPVTDVKEITSTQIRPANAVFLKRINDKMFEVFRPLNSRDGVKTLETHRELYVKLSDGTLLKRKISKPKMRYSLVSLRSAIKDRKVFDISEETSVSDIAKLSVLEDYE